MTPLARPAVGRSPGFAGGQRLGEKRDDEAQETWLFDIWVEIDAWIGEKMAGTG